MESQPLTPEFSNNPENFHPCEVSSENLMSKIWSQPLLTAT